MYFCQRIAPQRRIDIFAQILTPNQHLEREIIEQDQVYVEARFISVGFIHSILGVVLNQV